MRYRLSRHGELAGILLLFYILSIRKVPSQLEFRCDQLFLKVNFTDTVCFVTFNNVLHLYIIFSSLSVVLGPEIVHYF